MKIWNFGITGAGLITDFHARAILGLPNTTLIGISGTEARKAVEIVLAIYRSAREMRPFLFE